MPVKDHGSINQTVQDLVSAVNGEAGSSIAAAAIAGQAIVPSSITVPPPGGPYVSTAVPGGGDYSAAVRVAGGKPWFDWTSPVYGSAAPAAAASVNRIALLATIAAVVLANGGLMIGPPGNYHIDQALPINMGQANVGMIIAGAGEGVTTITQDTAATDVFQLGANSLEVADNIAIRDMTISATRYGLNLNNVLHGIFERLVITGGVSNVFTQGQCESNVYRNLQLLLASGRAFDARGNLNGGGAGGPLNLPENQKCRWEHIRIFGSGGLYAFDLDAGSLGGQQTSPACRIDHLIFESNTQNSMRLGHVGAFVSNITNEDHPSVDSTNVGILIDSGAGFIRLTDSTLGGQSNGHTYKYCIQQIDGILLMENVITGAGGASATADIYLGAGNLVSTLINVAVTDAAHLSYNHHRGMFINVLDSSGVPLNLSAGAAFVAGLAARFPANGITGFGSMVMAQDLRRSLQVIAWAATVTPDPTQGEIIEINPITGSFTIANPATPVLGQVMTFRLVHDNTGGNYVIAWGNAYKRAGGAFVFTVGVNALDTITYECNSSNQWMEVGRAQNLS